MRLKKPTRTAHYIFYGLIYLAGPLLALQLLAWVDQPYILDDAYLVQPSAYVVSFADSPPASGWRDLETSKPPAGNEEGPFNSIWYRYDVGRTVSVPAMYFPNPAANLDIWYQGERLVLLGPMARPIPNYHTPVLLPFPAVEGDSASAVFYVRVARYAPGNAPSIAYIAPYDLAKRDFDDQNLTLNLLPVGMLIFMAIFGAIILSLFLVNRKDSAYGWYSLMILLWGLHSAHQLIEETPLQAPMWFALGYMLLGWIVVEFIFVNRFFSIPAPRTEKALVAITAVIFAGLVAIALGRGYEAMTAFALSVLIPWTLICAILVTSRYFVAIRQDWSYESLSLWLASGVFIGVGVRDILYQLALPWVVGSNYYLQYIALLPVGLFGWHLIRRFVEALRIASLRTEELDATVEERTNALERSYAKLAAEDKRRSIEDERSRLMRDMHDGLGGQLVHALALSEQSSNKDLQSALRYALSDLRMVVDSLAPDYDGVHELLAAYRHRVSKSLETAGIDVHWDIDEVTDELDLDPKEALTVLRILQEAVTNATRHSNCKVIRVSLANVDNGILLRVSDNGDGMKKGSSGRGLQNMRVRAREIGAELDIDSSANGTVVTCHLPNN